MIDPLTPTEIRPDGTITDVASVAGHTRSQFLTRAIFGAGALSGAGALLAGLAPGASAAVPSAAQDVEILNFAIVLEYLGAAFYDEAIKRNSLRGEDLQFAKVLRAHEQNHVAFVSSGIKSLGGTVRPSPTFDFAQTTASVRAFRSTSIALEGLCVEALDGAAPLLTKPTLANAGMLVSVEARHVAWISDIARRPPAPAAFNPARDKEQVQSALNNTRFVAA
jgi:Ferritin-like domain